IATVFTGRTGKDEGQKSRYFAKPTVFTDADNDMTLAQDETFRPVTTLITYDSVSQAIHIANDTTYVLVGYVVGKDEEKLQKVALNIRAGRIVINGASADFSAPFGGYKHSGIGREWGDFGIEEYLEVKSVLGMSSDE